MYSLVWEDKYYDRTLNFISNALSLTLELPRRLQRIQERIEKFKSSKEDNARKHEKADDKKVSMEKAQQKRAAQRARRADASFQRKIALEQAQLHFDDILNSIRPCGQIATDQQMARAISMFKQTSSRSLLWLR